MTEADFEKLVKEGLDALPQRIREKMDNVEIVVEKGSARGPFLGLYQGVPKNVWGSSFGMRLPDKITIFQESLERMASSPKELKGIVKYTVWHEIAHHFGMSEEEIQKTKLK